MIPLRTFTLLSSALASLLIILVGGMIPSATFIIKSNLSLEVVDLPISWQVPALIFTGLFCGPKAGMIAVIAYLTIGLFYLPVFQGGGSLGYIATPAFGYLAGFIPAVWVTGRMAQLRRNNSMLRLFITSISGLTIVHAVGIINIFAGALTSRWDNTLLELLYIYSISNLPFHILLCLPIVLLTKSLRKVLILE